MTNPLEDIENNKGQHDMGVLATRILKGALEENDNNLWLAFWAAAAFWAGTISGGQTNHE